ncbi:MAG: Gfo/Idh/MocA family protein [Armatimonadota bacterium]
MMAETIRIGAIGSGGNARGHMRRMVGIAGVELVAIADPSEEAIKAAVAQVEGAGKLPVFENHKEMLEQVEMDAVVISTPHTLHYEQIMDSLGAGLHVLCEKPMVCNTTHAQRVIEEWRKSGKVMGVSYQRHTMGQFRYCRERIISGEMGDVVFVNSLQSQAWYQSQVTRGTWRSQMKWSGGGQLNDSGSHLIDIVLWMTGLQPDEVFAYQDTMGSEVDILSAIDVKFEGGALCTFSVVGYQSWPGFFEETTIWLQKGQLAIRGDEVWEWTDKKDRKVISGAKLGRTWSPDENFIAAIRGEEEIQSTPDDALKVIQLSEAAWASAASGKPERVVR